MRNRYINFTPTLALHGPGPSACAVYGALNFHQAVELAYEQIVSSGAAGRAGINAQAAVAYVESRAPYFQQLAHERWAARSRTWRPRR